MHKRQLPMQHVRHDRRITDLFKIFSVFPVPFPPSPRHPVKRKNDRSYDCNRNDRANVSCVRRENGNVTCLPQDFVCDGDEDCPNKEDEKQCRMMKEFAADR